MTHEEQKKKIEEYSRRNTFWTDKVLNQLSFSINLFTTLGVALLAYLIENVPFQKCSPIPFWKVGLYLISFLFAVISITSGIISITSKLYDLRITRHLISTRKLVMNEKSISLPDDEIDIAKYSLFKNYFASVFKNLKFISEKDLVDTKQLKNKFNRLRMQSNLLVELTWKSHKVQILMLLGSSLLYSFKRIILGMM